MSPRLIDVLEAARQEYEQPIIITSGYRCPAYNATFGRGPEHMRGEAADIKCLSDPERMKLIRILTGLGVRRIGIGPNFIHVGVSTALAQDVMWTYYYK